MAVVTAALAAGLEGLELYMNMQAQKRREELATRELNQRREVARQLIDVSQAPRQDAFGNVVKYVPGVGFVTETTPQTESLLAAQQREELKSLTEDAVRNREIRRRAAERGEEANELAREQIADLRFRPEPNPEALGSDLTRLALLGRRRGLDQAKDVLAQQALRLGRGGDISDIMKSADEQFGKSHEEALLRGKLAGRQEARTQRSANLSDALRTLTGASQAANAGIAPVRNTTAGQSINNLVSALVSGASGGIGRAGNTISGGIRNLNVNQRAPDASGLANAILKIKPEDETASADVMQAIMAGG